MSTQTWIAAALCWAAMIPSGARWLRVAQREHYLAGSATRFAFRWWIRVRPNVALAVLAVVAALLSWPFPLVGVVTAGVGIVGPLGLSIRGRTSPLHWTRRFRTLGLVWCVLGAAVVGLGVGVGRASCFSASAVVVSPLLVDLACWLTAPLERRVASRFVAKASARLGSVNPRIIGITGSFGKTSTKNYVAHLLQPRFKVVATPASFNNRAGLARAINEHLVAGTEVFVAEMGTYGRGEIAELCRWCPPEIAVITAIGPVHLERFGSEEAILGAKTEITRDAKAVALNVDNPWLADLGDQLARRSDPLEVFRCSSEDPTGDVCVALDGDTVDVFIRGRRVAGPVRLGEGVQATNLACALAVGLYFGLAPEELAGQIEDLPMVPHRLAVGTSPNGVVVIDDTFNSNPTGSRAALRVLAAVPGASRRVVVTPGMVELGHRQAQENEAFAAASMGVATELVIVGHTNRAALCAGSEHDRAITVKRRDDGVRWVREHLGAGDAVLYENDLPDHYP